MTKTNTETLSATIVAKTQLKVASDPRWLTCVLQNFDSFLLDHAAAEKKASGMAMSMLSHYPDKPEIVRAMADLALEEMNHFREVIKLIYDRGLALQADEKDEYINQFRAAMRRGKDVYLMDRLLIGSIVEARGAERFGLVADALPEGKLKRFYQAITKSEEGHLDLFYDLACRYFNTESVDQRLEELLLIEADIVRQLPIRAALH